jgi:hypothetical protein
MNKYKRKEIYRFITGHPSISPETQMALYGLLFDQKPLFKSSKKAKHEEIKSDVLKDEEVSSKPLKSKDKCEHNNDKGIKFCDKCQKWIVERGLEPKQSPKEETKIESLEISIYDDYEDITPKLIGEALMRHSDKIQELIMEFNKIK